MKLEKLVPNFIPYLCVAWVSLIAISCASSQQGEGQSDEQYSGGEENYGNQDEYGGQNSAGESDDSEGNGDSYSGEAVNNAVDDEFAENPNASGFEGGNGDAGAYGADYQNQVAEQGQYPQAQQYSEDGLNPIPGGEVAMPTGSTAPPMENGFVYYVQYDGVQAMSAVSGGTPLKTYEQGDPTLTWPENDQWMKNENGQYIPKTGIAVKGIGRSRKPANWR